MDSDAVAFYFSNREEALDFADQIKGEGIIYVTERDGKYVVHAVTSADTGELEDFARLYSSYLGHSASKIEPGKEELLALALPKSDLNIF